MDQSTFNRVDQYYVDLFALNDEIMQKIKENCEKAGLPAISISPPLGMMLQILARSIKARRILEIGTLGGYSGTWLARALPADGRLVTLEFEKKHAEVAKKNFALSGFENKVQIINDDAAAAMQTLIDQGSEKFDMIFLDADKQNYVNYLRLGLQLSRPGTLIVADNVVRKGEVANPECQDESVRGIQRFLKELADNKAVQTTALQTTGSKGYDGFSVSLVL